MTMSVSNYLKELVLLRNDPVTVVKVREAAARGEPDAFYALGLIYAEGRGIPVDLAQAHYWLSRAIDAGDRDADLLRNIVGSQMSDDEYAAAKRLRAKPALQVVENDASDAAGPSASASEP
jgi:TPR repeat protein